MPRSARVPNTAAAHTRAATEPAVSHTARFAIAVIGRESVAARDVVRRLSRALRCACSTEWGRFERVTGRGGTDSKGERFRDGHWGWFDVWHARSCSLSVRALEDWRAPPRRTERSERSACHGCRARMVAHASAAPAYRTTRNPSFIANPPSSSSSVRRLTPSRAPSTLRGALRAVCAAFRARALRAGARAL